MDESENKKSTLPELLRSNKHLRYCAIGTGVGALMVLPHLITPPQERLQRVIDAQPEVPELVAQARDLEQQLDKEYAGRDISFELAQELVQVKRQYDSIRHHPKYEETYEQYMIAYKPTAQQFEREAANIVFSTASAGLGGGLLIASLLLGTAQLAYLRGREQGYSFEK